MPLPASLTLAELRRAYADARLSVRELSAQLSARADAFSSKNIWIHRASADELQRQASRLDALLQSGAWRSLPLFGVPFAVKDNIDVGGVPTTAACPAFAYTPQTNAPVIGKLIQAGALFVGKTNMDQFATGLVGTRSPYGACRNAFDDRMISGGSSSGSAVAVALGLAAFSLGTDTAGSGRVPAAFNNIVGLKPTRGTLSTQGVVPACRSVDCVSIFALTPGDALRVWEYAHEPNTGDASVAASSHENFRIGVPNASQLEFFGDRAYESAYRGALQSALNAGFTLREFDYAPFRECASRLYEGPWLAERLEATETLLREQPDALLPVIRAIIEKGRAYSASDAFRAQYELDSIAARTAPVWDAIDAMLLPTAGTTYSIEEVEADPINRNRNLGYYTNFVNLLNLAAISVPAGFTDRGMPFGVTLIGRAGSEYRLARMARAFGDIARVAPGALAQDGVAVAVFGLHLSAQKLNYQLRDAGARLLRATKTSNDYSLYAVMGEDGLAKPGVVHTPGRGAPIACEVWQVPPEKFGAFVAAIPRPLGIGGVVLEDGSKVKGFICESYALEGAHDITRFGGWLAYLAAQQ